MFVFNSVPQDLLNETFTGMLDNMVVLFISLIVLSLAWASNFGLSIYTSTKLLGESFDVSKMFVGVQKLLILIVSLILLSVSISFIPMIIVVTGVSVDAEVLETVSMVIILGLNVDKIIYYISQCIDEYKKILNRGE